MNKTLLILAAGIGSRYGGIKQLESFGNKGQTIIEYSVFDAIQAGFNEFVFVIRRSIEKDFLEFVYPKLKKANVELKIAFQEMDDIPYKISFANRVKPWGTSHAVWSARNQIKNPFVMINADDFYGRSAFMQASNFLDNSKDLKECAIITYKLLNTMSKNGLVSRGVCSLKEGTSYIDKVAEHKSIYFKGDDIVSLFNGEEIKLAPETLVSMNMIAFKEIIFPNLEWILTDFFKNLKDFEKEEALIPNDIGKFNEMGIISLKSVQTDSVWFGVTYKEDKDVVRDGIRTLIKNGVYPEDLF